METSSSDAERLSHMTEIIHKDAIESVEFAKKVSQIDEQLSTIVSHMFEGLKGGSHAITNKELENVIANAKKSHKDWLKGLNKIVREMRIYPIQTNSKKCAFGHFYHAIQVDHNGISEEWNQIDSLHNEFHNLGDKVINAVTKHDQKSAEEFYNKAEEVSNNMINILEKIQIEVEELTNEGVKIFG
ncbi:CZB domain-containing protein [Clostridium brassicae]